MRRRWSRIFAGLVAAVLAGALLSVPGGSPAQASGWAFAHREWTSNGAQVRLYGQAYAHDYLCGIKDCADAKGLYFQMVYLSGPKPDKARVSASIKFTGSAIDVTVSYPWGVSAGFTDGGASCDHGWWESKTGVTWVEVNFGNDVICKASTIVAVTAMQLSTTGAVRHGGSWVPRTATDCVVLGAFGC